MLGEIRLVSVQPSGWERTDGWSRVHARCWVLRDRAGCFFGSSSGLNLLDPFLMPGCMGEGYRPYFENYTVDASILDSAPLQVSDRQDSHGAAFGLRSCKSLDLQLFEL